MPLLLTTVWRHGLLAAGCLMALVVNAQTPARAPFEDSLAQRLQACTACHGAQGRAAPDGYYPRIAGKPAGYLYNQLLNFRDGRRHYRLMAQMVDPLTDSYLWEIARHFAALDLPYAAPAPVTVSPADLARGQRLAQQGDAGQRIPACASCHGAALTGMLPHTPGLLGLPRDYLNSQLGAWRTGQRRAHAPDCMAQVAQQLSQSDVSAVSGWLATQAVPADAHPAPRPAAPLPVACGGATPPGGRP
ncbi:c-type cytochrome [Hydrogenophaga sp. OTU3427]|uniref:c-type cytochrome n=1 Tax=Hydrogenophaga sp. OTU3427 TaxID=3043856 RepID=UPI00406CF8D7